MIRIHITIDTEFSSCGFFNDPPTGMPVAEPAVRGIVDGSSEGLGFMLAAFQAYGIRATFFVESLHTTYFGDAPMGAIAREIHAAGHDVQAHLHPCWIACAPPHSPKAPARPARDNLGALDVGTAAGLIGQGLATFERWGVPRPIAFRAGNLQASLATYAALRANGVAASSNLALGVHHPAEPELHLQVASVNVVEICVGGGVATGQAALGGICNGSCAGGLSISAMTATPM